MYIFLNDFYLKVFKLDLQVPLMVLVFFSQKDSMAVVASLPQNFDGYLNIEVDLTFPTLLEYSTGSRIVTEQFHRVYIVDVTVSDLDELFQLGAVLQLSVTV